MAGRIEIERDDRGVETIWLNNQDHRNTLNNSLIDDMAAAIHRSSSDNQCHVIIIRGRGGVFCAGRELRDLAALLDADISLIQATYHRLRMLNEALYLCRKPTIAVVKNMHLVPGPLWQAGAILLLLKMMLPLPTQRFGTG